MKQTREEIEEIDNQIKKEIDDGIISETTRCFRYNIGDKNVRKCKEFYRQFRENDKNADGEAFKSALRDKMGDGLD